MYVILCRESNLNNVSFYFFVNFATFLPGFFFFFSLQIPYFSPFFISFNSSSTVTMSKVDKVQVHIFRTLVSFLFWLYNALCYLKLPRYVRFASVYLVGNFFLHSIFFHDFFSYQCLYFFFLNGFE